MDNLPAVLIAARLNERRAVVRLPDALHFLQVVIRDGIHILADDFLDGCDVLSRARIRDRCFPFPRTGLLPSSPSRSHPRNIPPIGSRSSRRSLIVNLFVINIITFSSFTITRPVFDVNVNITLIFQDDESPVPGKLRHSQAGKELRTVE